MCTGGIQMWARRNQISRQRAVMHPSSKNLQFSYNVLLGGSHVLLITHGFGLEIHSVPLF